MTDPTPTTEPALEPASATAPPLSVPPTPPPADEAEGGQAAAAPLAAPAPAVPARWRSIVRGRVLAAALIGLLLGVVLTLGAVAATHGEHGHGGREAGFSQQLHGAHRHAHRGQLGLRSQRGGRRLYQGAPRAHGPASGGAASPGPSSGGATPAPGAGSGQLAPR